MFVHSCWCYTFGSRIHKHILYHTFLAYFSYSTVVSSFVVLRRPLCFNYSESKKYLIVVQMTVTIIIISYLCKTIFSLFVEALLLERSPAIAVDFLYVLEVPDFYSSDLLSRLGSDLEYRYGIKSLLVLRWTASFMWTVSHLFTMFVPATFLKSLCVV